MLGLSPFITILINKREGNGPSVILSLVTFTVAYRVSRKFEPFFKRSVERLRSMDNKSIVRGLREITRRSEVLERIYGSFPLVDPLGVWIELPYLLKGYIERKQWN